MKNLKGFTLVELVIVIVIVGILSIVAVPIYRGYTRKAMSTEAKALLKSVNSAQQVYYSEYHNLYSVGNVSFDVALSVDARSNKYFTSFSVAAGGSSYSISTNGTSNAQGITVTLTGSSSGGFEIVESGL